MSGSGSSASAPCDPVGLVTLGLPESGERLHPVHRSIQTTKTAVISARRLMGIYITCIAKDSVHLVQATPPQTDHGLLHRRNHTKP